MAGIITVTVNTMTKEVPKSPTLQAPTANCDGYVTQTDISFNVSGTTYSLDAAGNGFSGGGFDGNDGEQILVITTSGLNDGLYTLVADTDAKLTVTEVVTVETAAAAGTVVVYGVQVYKITPTKATRNLLIIYSEGVEAAGEAGMIPCVLNGSFWAANNDLYTAFAATTGTDKTWYLFIETAPYMQADGTIKVMLKPLATKSLYTDHRPALSFLELP